MAGQQPPYITTSDKVVGEGHATLPDVANRVIKWLLDESAMDVATTGFTGLRPVFNAKTFGADPSHTAAANTLAFQELFAEAAAATVYLAQSSGGPGANSYSPPKVVIMPGDYSINDEIELPTGIYLDCHDVAIRQTDPTKRIFVPPVGGTGYLTRIRGIHFVGGKQQLVLTRPNTDTSMNLVEECSFSAADPTRFAMECNLRSGHLVLRRCRVLDAPKFLDTLDCDYVVLDDCWINGYARPSLKKPTDTASFNFATSDGATPSVVCFNECVLVPEGEASPSNAKTRWIDLHNFVALTCINTQFGAENAGFPIVYSWQSAGIPTTYPFVQAAGVSFVSCPFMAGGNSGRADRGAVILKTGCPNKVIAVGCSGLADSYLVNDTQMVLSDLVTPTTITAYLAAIATVNHPRIAITDIGNTFAGTSPLSSATLLPYTLSWSQAVGGRNALSVPKLVARQIMQIPGLSYSECQALTGFGDGVIMVDVGNGQLIFNVGAGQRYVWGSSSGFPVPGAVFRTLSASGSVTFADRTIFVDSTAGAVVVTLPTANLTPGQEFTVKWKTGANAVSVKGATGVVDGAATKVYAGVLESHTFTFDGGNYWIT